MSTQYLKWLKDRKIDRLEKQAMKDKKTISNLMDMNHQLIQTLNAIPAKHRKGLTEKDGR